MTSFQKRSRSFGRVCFKLGHGLERQLLPELGVALDLGADEQSLREGLQFAHQALLPCGIRLQIDRAAPVTFSDFSAASAEALGKQMVDDLIVHRLLCGREDAAGGREHLRTGDFGVEGGQIRCGESSRRGDGSHPFWGLHRDDTVRIKQVLQHQRTRCDEAGDLRIAQITQQAEDIALDRLLPHAFTRCEVAH
jgi:hypothetical protein